MVILAKLPAKNPADAAEINIVPSYAVFKKAYGKFA